MEDQDTAQSLWYALRVRTKCEKVVESGLIQRDIESYLPLYRTVTQWSDRVKTNFVPLFPGYVFAKLNREKRPWLSSVSDFMYIVGRGNVPEPLDEREITAVKRLVSAGMGTAPWPFCEAGELVEVIRGPLAGLQGVYLRMKSHDRLVISISLLQRSISTEIESYNVRRASAACRAAGAA
jgi:transcription antitermination factor NusG